MNKLLYRGSALFLLNFIFTFGYGQKETQKWIVGYQPSSRGKYTPDTGGYKLAGGTIIDFKSDPPSLSRVANSLSLDWAHTTICDTSGNILFYTNGTKIFNWAHEPIENADTLNFSKAWEGYDSTYYLSTVLGTFPQNTLVIPNPYVYNQFYIVSLFYDWGSTSLELKAFTKIMYSTLDMNLNGGKGKLILKEKLLATGNFNSNLIACKKSNGIDWWVLVRNVDSSGTYNILSIGNTGVELSTQKQRIGLKLWSKIKTDSIEDNTSASFSQDGRYMAYTTHAGIELYNFNRCSGTLSNFQFHPYPLGDTLFSLKLLGPLGLSFSDNSKMLYCIFPNRIYQYEVRDTAFEKTQIKVASRNSNVSYSNNFCYSKLASDGRIYIGNADGGPMTLSVIDSPNKKGIQCGVKIASFNLLTISAGVPSFPNYALGARNCCEYSGNHQLQITDTSLIAKDSGKYQWYYCDGTYMPIPNETKSIFKPKKSGNYALRIANIFCTDTSACTYYKLKSGIIETEKETDIFYPNPTHQFLEMRDQKFLSTQNYSLLIFNMQGSEVLRIPISNEHIDVSSLPNGFYGAAIKDKNGAVLHIDKLIISR